MVSNSLRMGNRAAAALFPVFLLMACATFRQVSPSPQKVQGDETAPLGPITKEGVGSFTQEHWAC
jgi:hypothetical protein